MKDEKFSLVQKNINALKQYNSFILNDLANINLFEYNDIVECLSENNQINAKFIANEKQYYLHSIVNPRHDSEKIVNSIDLNRDNLIIVFGIGCGHHLRELKKRITKDTRVIIVEHNMEILKFALINIDLSDIFQSPQFLLIYGDEKTQKKQMRIQAGSNFYNMAYNVQYLALPNYYIYSKENAKTMAGIATQINRVIVSMGNSIEDMFNGFRNNYLNLEAIFKSNRIDEIEGKYKDIPAIIVSAGPSLDKNVELLKKVEGKAVIIACDASLRICEKLGVKVDAVASIERDETTYKYYYENHLIDEGTLLVGPGLLWPEIYKSYKGKHILMSKFPKTEGVEGWWYSHFDNIDFVNQGMSCANVAYSVAKIIGCNPIILIGQDLAYTDDKIHSQETHTELEGDNTYLNHKGIGEETYVYLKSVDGGYVKSNIYYKAFKEWFESMILLDDNVKVIDATEGGAYIEGTECLLFRDVIEKYCIKDKIGKLSDGLDDIKIEDEKIITKIDLILKNLNQEFGKIKYIELKTSKHFEKLEKIRNMVNKEMSKDELIAILMKIKSGDKIIQKILGESTIQSFYKHIIVTTIMEVKAIGNEVNYENVSRNIFIQMNLMYMLKESSKFIKKEYEEMQTYLINKKVELEGVKKS